MKLQWILALLFTLSVLACNKKESNDLLPNGDQTATANDNTSQAKVGLSGNTIEYRIATAYEKNYVHWCQLWDSPLSSYERANACGPTSYMIAAHMIAAAHGYGFMPVSGTKLKAIVTKMGGVPISMTQISSHVTNYDSPPLSTLSYTTTNRNAFKSFLEAQLAEGEPLIVPIRISGSLRTNDSRYTDENSLTNYDLDIVDKTTRPNYINTSGVGHFVVVIGIKKSLYTCNDYIYYKDPLAQSGATKVCSYERFLSSAAANGASNLYYDALVIKKQ